MATPKIKATYSLDPETVRSLERMAALWSVSKSEALRRVILLAAGGLKVEGNDGIAALDELQGALSLSRESAREWVRQAGSIRKEASERSEGRKP